MKATIRIHSAYKPYFDKREYVVDVNSYYDLLPYFKAIHPKFKHYTDMIEWGQVEESFAFLDSNFRFISRDELFIKAPKEDEKIYLAPVIVGGGGKRGRLLLFAAVAYVAAPAIAAQFATTTATSTGAAYAAASGAGAAGGSAAAAGYSAGASAGGGFLSSLASIGKSFVGNLALSLVSRAFARRKMPTSGNTSESPQRDAGMFGSLTNSTSSGTPIGLNYGLVRVSGQYLSGYVDSKSHDKEAVIRVGDQF